MSTISPESSRTLELRVGLFVLVGLAIAGALIVNFGRLGAGLRPRYALRVEFPNASGLLKNSKVLLAGAQVGSVTSLPTVLPGGRGVSLEIKIFENIKIPKTSTFVVGSSGLLGDRFVDVVPKPGAPVDPDAPVYQPGDTVKGERLAGMEELTQQGGLLLADLRGAVANVNTLLTHVNEDVFKPATLDRLDKTMVNLEAATRSFKASSDQLGGLMTDARGTVADARTAIGGAQATLDSAKKAADDLRGAIADTRKALAGVQRAADQATRGNGPVARLLNDKQTADDLSALISNLRRSGVLFYKNRPPEPAPAPPTEPRRP
ncbi:MAG: MCE family protein [Verrucomicrobia bacterium]|nr:MCE family protein [Verrucomicrobiota bacterium]